MAIAEALNPQNNSAFKLHQGIFLVEGARRAALYDTTRGNVYSLNQEATNTVKGLNNDNEFLLKLASMGLAALPQNSETELISPEVEIPKPNL